MVENKVKFGLKNVHVFPIEEESDTEIKYGKVIKLPGAVNLSLNAEGEDNPFHADDVVYYNSYANNGYSGDLEIARITEEFTIEILGQVKDDNGALIESVNDKMKNFAMAFEFQGDKNATRNILYKVSVGRPSEEHQTISDTKEPQTDTLSMTAMARISDGLLKARVVEGQAGYDTFYDKVYEPKITASAGSEG